MPSRLYRKIFFAILALLFFVSPSEAASISQPKLMAVYLFRLAENIQWANQENIHTYRIHLIDDSLDIFDSLKGISRVKKLHGKPFKVTRSGRDNVPEGAHLVFVSKGKSGGYEGAFYQVEGRNTLLISENVDNKRVVMINLFDTKEKEIHFEINKANILNQNLGVNPDIILLGGTEIDVANLYKEAQLSIQAQDQLIREHKQAVEKEKRRLEKAEAQTREQKNVIAVQEKEIDSYQAKHEKLKKENMELLNTNLQQRKAVESGRAIQEETDKITREQTRTITEQETLIREEHERYETLSNETLEQQKIIDGQKVTIEQERKKYERLTASVQDRAKQLETQGGEIMSRSVILSEQAQKIEHHEAILAQQSDIIVTQRNFLFLFAAFVLFALIFALVAFRGYRQKKRANIQLMENQDLLNKTSEQLEKAKESAEAANLAKSKFLANMSHEIRTLMNAIIGFTEILKEKEHDSQKYRYFESLHSSGKALLGLINNILDISRLEDGKLNLQYSAMSISGLFQDVKVIFDRKITDKGIKLIVEIGDDLPEFLICDETRVRQILINLLENAVKFTDKGHIRIAAFSRPTKDESHSSVELIMEVEDTGIGISPGYHREVFDVFCQEGSEKASQSGGTGLGLAITRSLVVMMNGEISVSSELGKGSIFRVTIPKLEISTSRSTEENVKKPVDFNAITFDPATVLIVDDVGHNREILATYLEGWEFNIIFAKNGREAIEQASKHDNVLILMDMKMPEMDGYEAVKIMSKDDKLKDIPVIAVTASVTKQSEEEISRLCDGYLKKPVSRSDLILEIMKHLTHTVKEIKMEVTMEEALSSKMILPPLKQIKKLLNISTIGSITELKAIINEIREMDLKYQTFTDQVEAWAHKYQFEKIIEFLEQHLGNKQTKMKNDRIGVYNNSTS